MQSRALKGINVGLLTNVRFFDFPNMAGSFTTFLHYQNKSDLLKDGYYFNEMIKKTFHKIEKLLSSDYFRSLVNDIKGKYFLSYTIDFTNITRIFIKEKTDLTQGYQSSKEEIMNALPYGKDEYVIQDKLKNYYRKKGKLFTVYKDIDFHILNAMIEIFYFCKYEENFLQYIVIGSGDKDYSDVCKIAKESGIVIIVIAFRGDIISKEMKKIADIVFILHPTLCIIKPYVKNIEKIIK